ncbi:MAG: hypothetical protein HN948_03085, partial [Clostridia bacterium]|nr:hypothetical protein [Clostridia bacterium]
DEALLGFAGSIVGYGGMFDIGGGSTEVMTGTLNNVEYKRSFDLGAVRLLQMFPSVDFADCDAYEQAHALASEFLANVPPADGFAYTGIGGTATAIAAIDLELVPYDAKRVQGHMISFERACSLCDMLKNKTKKQREKIDSLQDSRADVIVLGAIIMLEFMKASKSSYITVSDSDNQEGYLKKKLGLL